MPAGYDVSNKGVAITNGFDVDVLLDCSVSARCLVL